MSLLGLPPLRPNFEAAVRDVAANNPALRIQAAERLGDATDDERVRALDPLRAMLSDRDARVRAAAVVACGRLRSAELSRALIALIDDVSPLVREVAVVALAHVGGEAAIAAVRDALRSDHPETRFQAALSYVELCPDVAEPLRVLIHDEDPLVRANVTAALALTTDAASTALLTECVQDHNPQVRRRAAIALANRGNGHGFREVVAALQEADLVLDAIEALGNLGNKDAADPIANRVTGPFRSLLVKAAAGGALAQLGDPRGVLILRQVLTAWRSDGRNLAVEIVGDLRLTELIPELAQLALTPRGTDPVTLAIARSALEATPNDESR
jgi:HEAT repeat protein